jgi:hypothetical protein
MIDSGRYLGLATASFLQAVEHRYGTTAAVRFFPIAVVEAKADHKTPKGGTW